MPNGVFSGSAGAAAFVMILALAPSPSAAQSQTDRLGQLATAIAPDMKDVRLDAPSADLDAGNSAKASITLPKDLFARIRTEAATLDLGKAADRIAVRAKLSATSAPGRRRRTGALQRRSDDSAA